MLKPTSTMKEVGLFIVFIYLCYCKFLDINVMMTSLTEAVKPMKSIKPVVLRCVKQTPANDNVIINVNIIIITN